MKNEGTLKLPIRKQNQCSVRHSKCYTFIKKTLTTDDMLYQIHHIDN